MLINALNSGANVFMADFEDSLSPTWTNVIQGQINLKQAVRRTLKFESQEGKSYSLTKSWRRWLSDRVVGISPKNMFS